MDNNQPKKKQKVERKNVKSEKDLLGDYIRGKINTNQYIELRKVLFGNEVDYTEIKVILKNQFALEQLKDSYMITIDTLRDKLKRLMLKLTPPKTDKPLPTPRVVMVEFKNNPWIRKFYKKHRHKPNLLEFIHSEMIWLKKNISKPGVKDRLENLRLLYKFLKKKM
jgi:hypothetical protein